MGDGYLLIQPMEKGVDLLVGGWACIYDEVNEAV